jgi:hypothetical protein
VSTTAPLFRFFRQTGGRARLSLAFLLLTVSANRTFLHHIITQALMIMGLTQGTPGDPENSDPDSGRVRSRPLPGHSAPRRKYTEIWQRTW